MSADAGPAGYFRRLPLFAQNVSFVFLAQVAVVLCGMLSNVIVARWLGPEGQGKYALCVLVGVMLLRFLTLNMGVAATVYVGNGRHGPAAVAGNLLTLSFTIIVVMGFCYRAFMPAAGPVFLKNLEPALFAPAFFLFPFSMLSAGLIGISRGLNLIKRAALIDMVETVSKAALMFAFVALLGGGVRGAVYAAAAASVCGLAYAVLILPRGALSRPAFDPAVAGDLLRFGLKGHLGNIVQFFNYRLDMFLVNFFLTPASVGVYSIAVMVAELAWYVPTAVASVLLPRTAAGGKTEADEFTPMICRITVAVTFVFSLFLALAAGPAIRLAFGRDFSPSMTPLVMLLPGIVVFSVSKVLASDLVGRGYPLYPTYVAAVSLGATVLLDVLLIPRWGLAGAAAASSVSYAVSSLLFLKAARGVSGKSSAAYLLMKVDDLRRLAAALKPRARAGAAAL